MLRSYVGNSVLRLDSIKPISHTYKDRGGDRGILYELITIYSFIIYIAITSDFINTLCLEGPILNPAGAGFAQSPADIFPFSPDSSLASYVKNLTCQSSDSILTSHSMKPPRKSPPYTRVS